MMLGRLLAGQEHIIRSVDRIDARLLEGDRRMGYLVETSARLDERVASLERKREPSGASRAERLIARWAAIIIPLVALLATGSWEVAIKLIAALK